MFQPEAYNVHPKFHVAVDCVIFGYEDDELKLLIYPRRFEPSYRDWSLMGGFVQESESMDAAARRVLELTVGLKDIFLEQVRGFSDPSRDTGDRVISMAYYALMRIDEFDKSLVAPYGGQWCPLNELPNLIFDHAQMVEEALQRLQFKATYELIGKELLPELFTLTQLNNLYNAIFQKTFDQGNFRKKIASLNVLERTSLKQTTTSKRGAYFYKFKDDVDHSDYDRIVKN